MTEETNPAERRRVLRQRVRDITAVVVVVVGALVYWFAPGAGRLLDKFVDPAVGGMAMLYSSMSTFVHAKTGLDLGLVKPTPDPEFEGRVVFATFVNERRAGPLIDIAVDKRNPDARREDALRALLQFDSTSAWLQPLLNELPKGGMVGVYSPETPILDALFRRVREEGGVRQPLERDYAGLVFSFMLQVPDGVLRAHAFRWLPDVLPDDALDMIVARIGTETDPDVRRAIQEALLAVDVVPKPESAAAALVPLFKNPPWETLKLPLAVVLARLGDPVSLDYLKRAQKDGGFNDAEKKAVTLALARTPYARAAEAGAGLAAKHEKERQNQTQAAILKRDKLDRQAKLRQEFLAKAEDPETPPYVGRKTDMGVPASMIKPLALTIPVSRTFEVASEAPLYNGPGEGRRRNVLPAGTTVNADLQAKAGGKTWYQVKTPHGALWVDAARLKTPADPAAVPETESPEGAFLEVAEEDVPVYAEARADSGVVGKLMKGNIVQVAGSDKVSGERWFEVGLKDGKTGWIRGDLNLKLTTVTEEK